MFDGLSNVCYERRSLGPAFSVSPLGLSRAVVREGRWLSDRSGQHFSKSPAIQQCCSLFFFFFLFFAFCGRRTAGDLSLSTFCIQDFPGRLCVYSQCYAATTMWFLMAKAVVVSRLSFSSTHSPKLWLPEKRLVSKQADHNNLNTIGGLGSKS